MIVTLTPNPSIDATLELPSPLEPGAVHRAHNYHRVVGGKGLNVTHAITLANRPSTAIFPSRVDDPFLDLVRTADLPHAPVTVGMSDWVRTNTTVTEPDGRTTKLNGPGPTLAAGTIEQLRAAVAEHASSARWVVLAGSLPQGVAPDWYAQLIPALREAAPQVRIAVDTSDAPLTALGQHLDVAAPDLIKPNGLELGQLAGVDGLDLERRAEEGDFSGVLNAARHINARGVAEVLVTLGGAGALLCTADAAWIATPPPVQVVSTVGAGDSSLAGYLLARSAGLDFAQSLQHSVAYGSAAAGLAGTTIPRPSQLDTEHTTVTPVTV
ncbi:1-phosphofructokinase family hexose kinase [Corynebacterium lizhenjunii]|uniref:1-phosphofructokinase family hexose kinase n=1 Tax=Corynebacterium lizhenjunii TaxID=2709394 RepID=A0A7T0KER6_9CORY|nr:1-phosphofructokinase family hexose kinase [Corynebacterium lizhenjunii]QPK78348.1 1-phosphofructokinase family hexose kinase [Corynebacterium lizhenjunii]